MARRAHRGFTLLEMLVAITVFGFLVSMVYGMLRLGSRGWDAGDQRIDQADAMRIGWTFVQRALNNARDTKNQNEDGEGLHFFGRPRSLEFVADMPAYLGTGGLHIVSLGIEDTDLDPGQEGPDRSLVLKRLPMLDFGTELGEEHTQTAVLVDQLEALKIDYYGVLDDTESRFDDEDTPTWHDDWSEASSLPMLVRISIHPYGEAPWPVLVAHPQLGSNRKTDIGPDASPDDDENPAGATDSPQGAGIDPAELD